MTKPKAWLIALVKNYKKYGTFYPRKGQLETKGNLCSFKEYKTVAQGY